MVKFEGRREYVQTRENDLAHSLLVHNVFYSVLETPHEIVLQTWRAQLIIFKLNFQRRFIKRGARIEKLMT